MSWVTNQELVIRVCNWRITEEVLKYSLMHRQVSNKFNTIKQGQKTVQELIHELSKYAAQMVQYLDNYLFRRQLIAALRHSLQKEVLHRGITVEFSNMQDTLEKANNIKDSSWYDIGLWMSLEPMHSNAYVNNVMARSSKWMIGMVPKGTAGQLITNCHLSKPIWNIRTNTCKALEMTGKQPSKKGELKCYECGQKGHMRPQCPNWGSDT